MMSRTIGAEPDFPWLMLLTCTANSSALQRLGTLIYEARRGPHHDPSVTGPNSDHTARSATSYNATPCAVGKWARRLHTVCSGVMNVRPRRNRSNTNFTKQSTNSFRPVAPSTACPSSSSCRSRTYGTSSSQIRSKLGFPVSWTLEEDDLTEVHRALLVGPEAVFGRCPLPLLNTCQEEHEHMSSCREHMSEHIFSCPPSDVTKSSQKITAQLNELDVCKKHSST